MSIATTQERMFKAGVAEGRYDLEIIQLAVVIAEGTVNEDALENWRRVASAYVERARQLMLHRLPVGSVETDARAYQLEASSLEEALVLDSEKGIDPRVHAHRFTRCILRDGRHVALWTMHHSFIDMIGINEVLLDSFPGGELAVHRGTARQYQERPSPDEVKEYWAGSHKSVRIGDRGQLVQTRRRVTLPDAESMRASPFLFVATLLAAQLQGERSVTVSQVYDARRSMDAGIPEAGPAIVVMPVSAELQPGASVAETLKRMERADRDARRFIATPPPGGPSTHSTVTLNFQPLSWRPRLRAAMKGVGMEAGDVVLRQHSSLPLVLHVENDDGWFVEITSWSGLHNQQDLEGLLDTCLLNLQALQHPSKSLQEVAEVPVIRGGTVLNLVDDPAELLSSVFDRCHGKIAVIDQGSRRTFGELSERASQYAAHLDRMSVPTGARVGVHSQRGFETYAALLGIILSGRVYVPLDPDYPEARLQYIVDDSALACLFSSQRTARAFGVPNTWLDGVPRDRVEAPSVSANADDVAYVIYTSGSTGKPKGVQIARSSLANLIHAQGEAFGLKADDRVLQFASLCFDASISEIFVTLGVGASLVVASGETRAGMLLQNLMVDEGVTIATLPPSVWATLKPSSLPSLTTRISAGEPCTTSFVERWSEYGKTVINAYGPTEATVCATAAAMDPSESIWLGEPINNVWLKIADQSGRSVWRGEEGEIVIGGAGVGLGYVTPQPHDGFISITAGDCREPAYRTGDLAVLSPTNRLKFLGRCDRQIKRNGIRIELGELESVLEEQTDVSQAVALLVPGSQELRAYVVTSELLNQSSLRAVIAKQLHAVLMPTIIVQLSTMPLTPSGKVDHQALLEITPAADPAEKTREITEMERVVANVWRSVLQVEELSLDVNFFDVGGTSLQAALIMGELSGLGEFRSPLVAQTVAAQAATFSATTTRLTTPLRRRQKGKELDG
jgi:amino acid adenylation domain-containing protein